MSNYETYHSKPTTTPKDGKQIYLSEADIKLLINQLGKDDFTRDLLSWDIPKDHLQKWSVGAKSENRNGDFLTAYIYRDTRQRIVNIKYIKYNGLSRDKSTNPFTLKSEDKKEFYGSCFFGEHLIDPDKDKIVIVESEKSAIIASYYFPQYNWIAGGGSLKITKKMVKILNGYDVIAIADSDKPGRKPIKALDNLKPIDLWPELDNGYDIADFLLCDVSKEELIELSEKIEAGFNSSPENELTISEYLRPHELFDVLSMDIPKIEYLIDGLLSDFGLTIFAGRPKIGKSYFLLNMAISIAYSQKVLHYFELKKDFDVLICDLESSQRRTKGRLQQVTKNYFAGERKNKIHILYRIPPFDQGGRQVLEQYLEKYPNIKLIGIDVLEKFFPMGKGDGGNAYATAYKGLGDFQEWLISNNIAGLVLHHLRKKDRKASGSVDIYEEFSGTTAITGVSDNLMALHHKDGELVLGLKGREQEDTEIVLNFKDGVFNTQGTDLNVVTKNKSTNKIIDLLKRNSKTFFFQKEIIAETGLKQAYVSKILRMLEDDKQVIRDNKKYKWND